MSVSHQDTREGRVCVCVCVRMECCSCKKKISKVTTWFVPGPTWLKKGLAECTYNMKIHQVTHILLRENSGKQREKHRVFRDQTHDQTLAPFFGARFNGQDFRSECKIQQSHQRLMGTMEVDGCWWFLSESSEGYRLNIDRTRSCYSDLPWYLGHFGPLWVWSDVSLLGKFVCTGTHYWGPGWLGSVEPDLWQAQ